MTLDDFKALVQSHIEHFSGVHPESDADVSAMETIVGHKFPESMRWLICTHGYADATGIATLRGSVEDTLRCRRTIGLPERWLILNDLGDAGLVLLDLETARICWCGAHELGTITEHRMPDDADWYDDFPSWCNDRLRDVIADAEESGS